MHTIKQTKILSTHMQVKQRIIYNKDIFNLILVWILSIIESGFNKKNF